MSFTQSLADGHISIKPLLFCRATHKQACLKREKKCIQVSKCIIVLKCIIVSKWQAHLDTIILTGELKPMNGFVSKSALLAFAFTQWTVISLAIVKKVGNDNVLDLDNNYLCSSISMPTAKNKLLICFWYGVIMNTNCNHNITLSYMTAWTFNQLLLPLSHYVQLCSWQCVTILATC